MNDSPASNSDETPASSNPMFDIAERSQRLLADYVAKQGQSSEPASADPLNIGHAFMDLTTRMMSNPTQLVEANMTLWKDYINLWQSTANRMMGQQHEGDSAATPAKDDRRFKDEAWQENDVFDFIKQSYLLTSNWVQKTVNEVDGLDDDAAQKVDFYTRQMLDAVSPSNFVMTNPQVLRETIDSKGENLVKGLENLLSDMEKGDGNLRISMTDTEAFEMGKNIATTPGKVVYRNKLMELLQFNPTTDEVKQTPLLIAPPWINKYYILDLREKNSFIKWATEQGHTVFVISWVNPDSDLAETSFEDYMKLGILEAIDAVTKATGEKQVNMIGYCIAGTLLASTLAYMKVKKDNRVKSATFFTTMIDFEEPGELGIFTDEPQIAALEQKMAKKGYLEGSEMATTFNMMRSNDLIWSFVINNYMLGKQPFPFDLLYWNGDNTRMPAKMHSFYLRNFYLENNLVKPGKLVFDGVPIDLRVIDVPVYVVSTREDHIAPWKSTYAATQLYSGPVRFVLSGSGHIAGIVNPPTANKYGYWTNTKTPADPDKFLEGAKQTDGSWWTDWDKWVGKYAGKQIPARVPGDAKLKVLADAPGPYVAIKA